MNSNRLSHGDVSVYDIHRFLRDNEIYTTEKVVKNLIKLYDSNVDEKLSYSFNTGNAFLSNSN